MNESDREPLVSICCLTYNHEPYIRDAIEGFLMQKTDFPFEILIHDDASTDGTADIIREYEAKYPNIIKPIYQTENQYSKGIKVSQVHQFPRAKGKYIAMCEGDDYWIDPYKLQKQVDFLEANPEYSMCFHNALLVYEKKEKRPKQFKKLEEREYFGEEILKEWTIPTASVVFKKDAYTPLFNPNFLYGDTILFLTLAEKGKLWCINEIMSIYRKHIGGLTSYKNANSLENRLKYIRHNEEIGKYFNEKYKNIIEEIVAENYIRLSLFQLRKKDISFIKYLYIGLRKDPQNFLKNISKIISKKISTIIS